MEKHSELWSWLIQVGLPETIAHKETEDWLCMAGANGLPSATWDICTAAITCSITLSPSLKCQALSWMLKERRGVCVFWRAGQHAVQGEEWRKQGTSLWVSQADHRYFTGPQESLFGDQLVLR
jgi:hypothetical protein